MAKATTQTREKSQRPARKQTAPKQLSLTLDTADLRRAMDLLDGVVIKNNTLPVLTCVKLMASAKSLKLHVTDLDIWQAVDTPAVIHGAGAVCITWDALHRIAKVLPKEAQISIREAEDSNACVISYGETVYELPTLPAEDWPVAVWQPSDPICMEVEGGDLHKALSGVAFAISTEETRYYLNGAHLLLKPDGEGLRVEATDGHRLACMRLDARLAAPPEQMDLIIPRKAVTLLCKMGLKGLLQLEFQQAKMRITAPGWVMTTKLIDGAFPDTSRVTPSGDDAKSIITLDRLEFAGALKRCSALATRRGPAVKLEFQGEVLIVSIREADEKGWTKAPISALDGEAITFGANLSYLLDVVRASKAQQVVLYTTDHGSPVLIRFAEDGEVIESEPLLVQMPMRV